MSIARSTHKHSSRFAAAMAVLLTAALMMLATPGAAEAKPAGGNNSANAKLCQKGGWQNLTRTDGSRFANESACTSYGAKGGDLVRGTAYPLAKADCDGLIGTTYTENGPGDYWRCTGPAFANASSFNETTFQAPAEQCIAMGGSLQVIVDVDDDDIFSVACRRP